MSAEQRSIDIRQVFLGGPFHLLGGICTPSALKEKGCFNVEIGSFIYQENGLSDSTCPIYGYFFGKRYKYVLLTGKTLTSKNGLMGCVYPPPPINTWFCPRLRSKRYKALVHRVLVIFPISNYSGLKFDLDFF